MKTVTHKDREEAIVRYWRNAVATRDRQIRQLIQELDQRKTSNWELCFTMVVILLGLGIIMNYAGLP